MYTYTMRFTTEVKQHPKKVWESLNLETFSALNPWWNPLQIHRFDGVTISGITDLSVGPFKQKFITKIIEVKQYEFTDVGETVPFPFKSWKHKHMFLPNMSDGTTIIDDISYECFPSTSTIMWTYCTLMFRYRQNAYRRLFG